MRLQREIFKGVHSTLAIVSNVYDEAILGGIEYKHQPFRSVANEDQSYTALLGAWMSDDIREVKIEVTLNDGLRRHVTLAEIVTIVTIDDVLGINPFNPDTRVRVERRHQLFPAMMDHCAHHFFDHNGFIHKNVYQACQDALDTVVLR